MNSWKKSSPIIDRTCFSTDPTLLTKTYMLCDDNILICDDVIQLFSCSQLVLWMLVSVIPHRQCYPWHTSDREPHSTNNYKKKKNIF